VCRPRSAGGKGSSLEWRGRLESAANGSWRIDAFTRRLLSRALRSFKPIRELYGHRIDVIRVHGRVLVIAASHRDGAAPIALPGIKMIWLSAEAQPIKTITYFR
jgi:hypothetical protein